MGDTDEVRDLLMEGASVHLQNNVCTQKFNEKSYSRNNTMPSLSLAIVQDWRKDTALIGACQSGQAATARVLLEHGAIADYQNSVRTLY